MGAHEHDGERSMFLDLKTHEGGEVTFGGIGKGKISGIGKIGIPFLAFIGNILYVEGLKYNLLNISQFCDSGYIILFPSTKTSVYSRQKMTSFSLLLDDSTICMKLI